MILGLYRLLQPAIEVAFGIVVVAFEIAVRWNPHLEERLGKIIQTFRMRKPHGLPAYLEVDYEIFRDKRPIWIHAASGEYEYAKPLVRELRKRNQLVFVTYFSPTYRATIENDPGVTASCPLPLDNAYEIRDLINRLNPRCLLIARTDTWPNMIVECTRQNVPSLLFSATFHSLSNRVRGLAGLLTRATYPHLTRAQGVTEEDCQTLRKFGVKHAEIAGDTRYDQVLARLEAAKPLVSGIERRLHPLVIVAGSVWPEDLESVLPGLIQEIKGRRDFSAILVPHEVSKDGISDLLNLLRARDLKVSTYSELESDLQSDLEKETVEILIVDRIGILAELYQLGCLAFVGGSFRKTVHSVMEPLAAGCVTLVGPKHLNNREAIEFQAERIPRCTYSPVVCAKHTEEFQEKLHAILAEIAGQKESGDQDQVKDGIRAMVKARGGATKKALDWIESFS